MKIARVFITQASAGTLTLLFGLCSSAFSTCDNGCACSPSEAPNSCDVAGWCVNRDNIKKEDLKTVTDTLGNERLYVKFSVTYLLTPTPTCPNLEAHVRPYGIDATEIYVTAKANSDLGSYNKTDPANSDLGLGTILSVQPIKVSYLPYESSPEKRVFETANGGILTSSLLPVPAGLNTYVDIVLRDALSDNNRPVGRQEFSAPPPKGILTLTDPLMGAVITDPNGRVFDTRKYNYVWADSTETLVNLPLGQGIRGLRHLPDGSRYMATTEKVTVYKNPKTWDQKRFMDYKREIRVPTGSTVEIYFYLANDSVFMDYLPYPWNSIIDQTAWYVQRRNGERWERWIFKEGGQQIPPATLGVEEFPIPGHPGYNIFDYWPAEFFLYGDDARYWMCTTGTEEICNQQQWPYDDMAGALIPGNGNYLNVPNIITLQTPPVPASPPLYPYTGLQTWPNYFTRRFVMPDQALTIEVELTQPGAHLDFTGAKLDWMRYDPGLKLDPVNVRSPLLISNGSTTGYPKPFSQEVGTCISGSLDIGFPLHYPPQPNDTDCARIYVGDWVELSVETPADQIVDHWDFTPGNFTAFELTKELDKACRGYTTFTMVSGNQMVRPIMKSKHHLQMVGGIITSGGCGPLYNGKDQGYFTAGQWIGVQAATPFPSTAGQQWFGSTKWYADPPPKESMKAGNQALMPDSDTTFCTPWALYDIASHSPVFTINCFGSQMNPLVISSNFSLPLTQTVSFAQEAGLAIVGPTINFPEPEEKTAPEQSISFEVTLGEETNAAFMDGPDKIIVKSMGSPQRLPRIYKQAASSQWEPLEGQTVQPGHASATLVQTGNYQVFVPREAAAAPAPTPSAAFGKVYVYPNPAKNGAIPTLAVECARADRIRFRIYDVSGGLGYTGQMEATSKTVNGKTIYELALPANKFHSGTYRGVVTADRSGADTVRQKFSFALIK